MIKNFLRQLLNNAEKSLENYFFDHQNAQNCDCQLGKSELSICYSSEDERAYTLAKLIKSLSYHGGQELGGK